MSIPASRVADSEFCPTCGVQGLLVGPGGPEVIIGGMIAGRLSDFCMCETGHVSPVAQGAAEVLIHGLPAARLGVVTLAGGTLTTGDPSVLIDGETFSVPSFITIGGDPQFQSKVLQNLFTISTTESGQALLASMAASGRDVRIEPAPPFGSHTVTDPKSDESSRNYPMNDDAFNGKGCDAVVYWDPDQTYLKGREHEGWGHPPGFTPDVGLFHEMKHAQLAMNGEAVDGPMVHNTGPARYEPYVNPTEMKVMGLEPHAGEYPSENSYRSDRGLPQAECY